jgi:hypothetical protein
VAVDQPSGPFIPPFPLPFLLPAVSILPFLLLLSLPLLPLLLFPLLLLRSHAKVSSSSCCHSSSSCCCGFSCWSIRSSRSFAFGCYAVAFPAHLNPALHTPCLSGAKSVSRDVGPINPPSSTCTVTDSKLQVNRPKSLSCIIISLAAALRDSSYRAAEQLTHPLPHACLRAENCEIG